MPASDRQHTLAKPAAITGTSLHTGEQVTLTLQPAPENFGFKFRRVDLEDKPFIPALVEKVQKVERATTIAEGGVNVHTVEHVISALAGMGVDNALITLNGAECPILDGSAAPYVKGIMEAGLDVQPAPRRYIKIMRQVLVRNNEASAALEPYNGRMLDLEIDFDSRVIGRQRMIFDWTPRKYCEDVSRARTFGFVRDAKILRQAGYALGSSLDNSITVHEDRILNPGGLRYEDEFVRHKLLDAIGDLALCGLPIYGRFRSYKGGHALNALVLHGLFASEANYEIVTAEDLPLAFDALDDVPDGLEVRPYLRSVG